MAARILLLKRAAAPLMAATIAGQTLYPSRVAQAEAPHPYEQHAHKKPIYDDFSEEAPLPKASTPVPSPTSDTIPASPPSPSLLPGSAEQTRHNTPQHGPTPTDRLAVQIGQARLFLHHYAVATEDAVNSTMDQAFHLEKSFTTTIASLAPARETGEQLMPGLVYVLVASMAGSIVTRNRNFVLRAAVPLALGVGAGWLVVPVTMGNVSALLWTYERRFPAVAEAHLKARESIAQGWHAARVHADLSKHYVDEKVTTARDVVEGWVKEGK
ncbi:Uu.00g039000.m01.CDS01 [Anthostomella pinea]|uniref:MICOS complex subunit n=1 Tax=Anthostomella pinea TaxID=933095 RepID=A0AAI8YDT5_9PEZI|nr:Uu.00g039000.m01.CDS01 [Anthostomella pinea]